MPVILFSRKRDLIEDRGYFFLDQKVKGGPKYNETYIPIGKNIWTCVDDYAIYR